MSEVDPAPLRRLVRRLSTWEWPVTKDQLLAMASEQGWQVTSNRPGKGARWMTGLTNLEASASVLDDELAALTVPTSERFGEETAARRRRRDTFTAQVELVSDLLGAPGQTSPGRGPSATWTLANGSSLTVEASKGCYWVLTSPEFVEVERVLGPNR